MLPTLHEFSLSPKAAQILSIFALAGLMAFLIWDERKKETSWKKLSVMLATLAIPGLTLILIFVRPELLPSAVVIPIRSWGAMVVVGMTVTFLVQRRLGSELGLTSEHVWSLWVYGGLAAAVGARLTHVLVNLPAYRLDPWRVLTLWDGGMVYYGGVLGSLVFVLPYLKRLRIGFLGVDVLIIGMALGHWIGRLGCLMAGCCYGRPTESWVGVAFPPGSIAHATLRAEYRLGADTSTMPLHPTQLYEAGLVLLLGLGLLWLWRHRRRIPGRVTALYFLGYAILRFGLELVRFDPERQFVLRWPQDTPYLLTTSQLLSLVLGLGAAFMLFRVSRTPRSSAGGPSAPEASRMEPAV